MTIFQISAIAAGVDPDDFNRISTDAFPPEVNRDIIDMVRCAFVVDFGLETLKMVDEAIAGPEGLSYLTHEQFEKAWLKLKGPLPPGTPEGGTKPLRISLFKAWGESSGPKRPQPKSVLSGDALISWLEISDNGQLTIPGQAMERLTGESQRWYNNFDAGDKIRLISYQDSSISATFLQRLASFVAGEDWKSVYRTTIGAPMGPRATNWLTKIMDLLPAETQALIDIIHIVDPDAPLDADTSSTNPSIQKHWDTLNISEVFDYWKSALNQVCPPSASSLSSSAAASGGLQNDSIVSAIRESNNTALMAQAANLDSAEEKATASGAKVEKTKIAELAKGTGEFSVNFRQTMDEAIAAPSVAQGLQIALKNPDALRLLQVKLQPSLLASSVHIQYISILRNEYYSNTEAEFTKKHGGRYSHAQAGKLIVRALQLEEFFHAGP